MSRDLKKPQIDRMVGRGSLIRERLGLAGGLSVLLLVGFAVVAIGASTGLIAADYRSFVADPYGPPGAGLWLGADALGRDLGARVIQGAQVSLLVGVSGALLTLCTGSMLGALAGLRGGGVDRVLVAITNAIAAIPPLIALLGGALILGPGVFSVIVVIGLSQWTGIFRSVRAEARRLLSADFVRAAEAMGAGPGHQLRVHLLPHLAPLLWTSAVLYFVHAIKVEAVLAYFGQSAQELPSWGALLAECGSELARGIWWPLVGASVPLALLVLAAQVLADRLSDRS
ncbi:MAG TPA: ABC transporter permease [Nannocystis exedens]|nr:ABC transporter permease [Nannocystis exedens]